MVFHSTNGKSHTTKLSEVIANGVAPDGGFYIPDSFPSLPRAFFKNIAEMSLQEIGYVVGATLFSPLLTPRRIKQLVDKALDFPVPVKPLEGKGNVAVLEMFHGPTGSGKDAGARFMARLLPMILDKGELTILMATSGDSGAAVADAFREVERARVVILYPRGMMAGRQIDALHARPRLLPVEVRGTLEDCQNLVKQALLDKELNRQIPLTAGNSINFGRQAAALICGFYAYARALATFPDATDIKIGIQCGNLGNHAAARMARQMGLPVDTLVCASNPDNTFVDSPQPGWETAVRALETQLGSSQAGIVLATDPPAGSLLPTSAIRGSVKIPPTLNALIREVRSKRLVVSG